MSGEGFPLNKPSSNEGDEQVSRPHPIPAQVRAAQIRGDGEALSAMARASTRKRLKNEAARKTEFQKQMALGDKVAKKFRPDPRVKDD